jgi:hypothetical protein
MEHGGRRGATYPVITGTLLSPLRVPNYCMSPKNMGTDPDADLPDEDDFGGFGGRF